MEQPQRKKELTAEDVVIAVMGVTGSGKTSFIQQFCKQNLVIGHGLESCTAKVDIVPCVMPDNRIIYLIDTPGFDDSNRTDSAILGEIADWLAETYSNDIKLSGIIYLHRITDTRVGGSGMKNLRMFRKLCGASNLGSVVLATTMWSGCKPDDGNRREAQLKGDKALWQPLFNKGAVLKRHDSGKDSGQDILNHLIERSGKKMELDIQIEMVTYGKKLGETGAGQEVQEDLDKLRADYEKELAETKKDMQEALKEKDAERQEELREHRAMIESQMQAARQETRRLEASREELRKEMKEEHRREVEELKREAAKRERAMQDASRENAERHQQLTRELSKMKQQMSDSRIKDRELAELKAAAARREETLQETARQNLEMQRQMNNDIAAVRDQISRSKMKEPYKYKYKYRCPCGQEYLRNTPAETVNCNTIGCGKTFNTSGRGRRSGTPLHSPGPSSGDDSDGYVGSD